jgi:hypothetical protein
VTTLDGSRFDALARSVAARPSRRRLIGLLAGLGLGGVLPRLTAGPAAAQEDGGVCKLPTCPPSYTCISCSGGGNGKCQTCTCLKSCRSSGIAGGGAVQTAGGDAHLALVATRTPARVGQDLFDVVGQVRWTDPAWERAGLALESTVVTFYGPLPDVEGGREVIGWMRTDQRTGDLPFVLRVVDAGPPGSGEDTAELWVGDPALADDVAGGAFGADPEPSGFGYAAAGTLVSGDLQLVNLAVPSATDEEGTPAS